MGARVQWGQVPTFNIYLSVRETAEALGLCEETVLRLIDRRLLRASTALRHLLLPRSEIIRVLE
jgi:excisionase family DNA binding protein